VLELELATLLVLVTLSGDDIEELLLEMLETDEELVTIELEELTVLVEDELIGVIVVAGTG